MRNATGGFDGYARSRLRPMSALLCCVLAFAGLTGCPMNGGGNGNEPDSLTGAIVSLISNIVLSGDQELSIVYNADENATSVEAFYVEVESTAIDAPMVGAEVVFATDLSTGDNQVTSLQTGSIPQGLYRVGLNLSSGSLSAKVLSQGTFRITELPIPVFTKPDQNITRIAGTQPVLIQATLGDPENAVNWRVFYVPAGISIDGIPAGQLGTQIETGRSNEAVVGWATAGVANGDYMVGISVTDSGQSVAQTSSDGNEDRILTVLNEFIITFADAAPPPQPPLVQVTKPSGPETLFAGETTQVNFSVTFFEGPPASYTIDVFYDFDGVADTGDEVIFAADLPEDAVSAVFAVDLIGVGDTVKIGVIADDGKNDPSTVYAPGSVTFGTPAAASVTCTQPSSLLNVKPNEGVVNVNWQTTGISTGANAPGGVDVFLRRTDANNMPTGPEILVLDDGLLNDFAFSFIPTDIGKFEVSVRITLDADPGNPLTDACPSLITVSSSPSVFWVGNLDFDPDENRPFQGAIFEGVNFEDNAGSAFAGGEDFDGDGIDEMIIAARYAKPEFVNPSGIGVGEAYMIRGNSARYQGRRNLNSVGSSLIPGFVFTGIDPVTQAVPDTDGLTSIFITRDADGDNRGEIAFGFPHVESVNFLEPPTPLASPSVNGCDMNPLVMGAPQFVRGGVVIVSSLNDQISLSADDTRGFRCPLFFVGQMFRDNTVRPEPTDGGLCSNNSSWMVDRYSWFEEGDCPPDGAMINQIVGCLRNTDPRVMADGIQESLIHPTFGFDRRLADPYICDDGDIPCVGLGGGCPASNPGGTGCDTVQTDLAMPICEQTIPLAGGGDPDCMDEKDTALLTLPLQIAFIEDNINFMNQTHSFRSGVYREATNVDSEGHRIFNTIEKEIENTNNFRSLIGARIIGRCVNEAFGTSITQSDDDLIISAPLIQRNPACIDEIPTSDFALDADLFLNGIGRTDSGLAYFVEDYELTEAGDSGLWQDPENLNTSGTVPPRPHQYLAGGSDSSAGPGMRARDFQDGAGSSIFGDTDERIQNVLGISDFNRDGREDIAVGAPLGDVDSNGTPDGVLYVAFRRAESLEGNFDLQNLKLSVNNVERLAGVMIREAFDSAERFGESIAGGNPTDTSSRFDFNFTEGSPLNLEDIAVGNPDGNNGTGEVVIVFGADNLISQQTGIPVEDEGGTPGLLTRRQGARITGIISCVPVAGEQLGSEFGFNIANIGDIDGDGRDDLAVAAPNATPCYDADITDNIDSLDPAVNPSAMPGVDLDLDGNMDDVSGPSGVPDGVLDVNDELRRAGLVYVILGSNDARDFAATANAPMDISIGKLGTADLEGFIIVGRRGERFAPGDHTGAGGIVHAGDFLGGGFAGNLTRSVPSAGVTFTYGGNINKADSNGRQRGRSFGIGRAGDVDGDGLDDLLVGSQLADTRIDSITGEGTTNSGEAYLVYGFSP